MVETFSHQNPECSTNGITVEELCLSLNKVKAIALKPLPKIDDYFDGLYAQAFGLQFVKTPINLGGIIMSEDNTPQNTKALGNINDGSCTLLFQDRLAWPALCVYALLVRKHKPAVADEIIAGLTREGFQPGRGIVRFIEKESGDGKRCEIRAGNHEHTFESEGQNTFPLDMVLNFIYAILDGRWHIERLSDKKGS